MTDPFSLLETNSARQLLFALYALGLGACFGALYDVFRIGRVFLGIGVRDGGNDRFDSLKLPLIGSRNDRRKNRRRHVIGDIVETAAVFTADILYFAIATPAVAVFLYHANYGEPRLYLALCAALGFSAYYFTLGKLVMLASRTIVFIIRSALAYLVYFTVRPIVAAVKYIAKKTAEASKALFAAIKRALYGLRSRRLESRAVMSISSFVERAAAEMNLYGVEIRRKEEETM